MAFALPACLVRRSLIRSTLTSHTRPRTTLQERFVRDRSAEASKHKRVVINDEKTTFTFTHSVPNLVVTLRWTQIRV